MDLLKDNRKKDWFWIENELIDRLDLTIYEKMAYLVLVRHADQDSKSYPSYSTIGEKAGCSSKQAQRAINSLIEKGLVFKKNRTLNGTKKKGSNLYLIGSISRDYESKLVGTVSPNDMDCESKLVGTVSPNDMDCESKLVGTVSPIGMDWESKEQYTYNNIYSLVINRLNKMTNKNYKSKTPKTKKLIDCRLNEGFELNDFYKVIENKSKSWIGTDMEKFLRPETLFGTKFESYLNENVTCEKKEIEDEVTEDYIPELNFETIN